MDYENKIIEFISGDELKLAFVTRQQTNKLQAVGQGGRSEKVTTKQILLVHGAGTVADFPSRAADLQERIIAISDDIDTELLWESVCDSGRDFSVQELAGDYFGDCSALEESALARQLFGDPLHFRRKGLAFSPRTADDVQNQLNKQQRALERAAILEQAGHWIQQTLQSGAGPVSVPEELEDLMGKVASFILQSHRNESVRLLEELFPRTDPRRIGVDLLRQTGRLPADADTFLLLNGVVAGFSEAAETHAASLPAFCQESDRMDFTGLMTCSIDDDDTCEVDDALTFQQDGDRRIVGIHIADPAVFVERDDPLDRVAADRPLTLYLPTTTVTMLPACIGCNLASLNQDELRPTLSFRVVFNGEGRLLDWSLHRGQVRVTHRLSYDQAEDLMASAQETVGAMLAQLHDIACNLESQRLANGALQIKRPELKVRVSNGQIEVTPLKTDSPARLLVSELMILANRLAAEFALSHDVPIIYRTQPPPHQAVKPMESYDPVVFSRTVRNLKRTRLTTHPEPHAGLGLDLYTQVSSPIRRFADLVIQRQLAAHLAGEPYPYEAAEIIEVLTTADAVEGQNRKLERTATRYWLLEHLRRDRAGQTLRATVLDEAGGLCLAELDDLCLQGRLNANSRHSPGSRISVRIKHVDPEKDLLVLETVE